LLITDTGLNVVAALAIIGSGNAEEGIENSGGERDAE
jgi:hypothetical protein